MSNASELITKHNELFRVSAVGLAIEYNLGPRWFSNAATAETYLKAITDPNMVDSLDNIDAGWSEEYVNELFSTDTVEM